MDAISLKNVEKRYAAYAGIGAPGTGELPVLDGISLRVQKGEFVGVLGPNGCGKSTLLKLVLGAVRPDAGSISVFGRPPEESTLGYVPQHDAGSLFPWLTAAENISFASKHCDPKLAVAKLEEFGILKYAQAYPRQMSGGIKQLTAIARATVNSEVFLFDEPFSALDYQNKFLVEEAFLKLRASGKSAILVSHDIEPAVLACDRIVVLSEKPARILANIPVTLVGARTLETRFSPAFGEITRQIYRILRGDS